MTIDFEKRKRQAIMAVFRTALYSDVFEIMSAHPRFFSPFLPILFDRVSPWLHDQKILFIHIPKNGGFSVARALYGSDVWHNTIRFYQFYAPELLTTKLSFSVMRDPVARFISTYTFFLAGGGDDVRVEPGALKRLRSIKTVDDYLSYLERAQHRWISVDNPARPQWWFMTDVSGRIGLDYIYSLELHRDALQRLILESGGGKLDHLNKTRGSYIELNEDQLGRVKKIYSKDFELYEKLRLSSEPLRLRGELP